ncbi:MAG: glycine zipper 2TM domain-containing protein [Rudaea sp.]|uniref:glycine zipper 2TM domain-containing protein n=1 Tax=Rudaea sp. TaxID=2136325 RepID=UPI0039E599BC
MKLSGILAVSMLLFAGFCHAQDRAPAHPPPIAAEATRYGWADVLRVDPVYETPPDAAEQTGEENPPPQPDCADTSAPPPQENDQADHRAAGTVIGALIGGVIGHAFGHGDGGNKASTAAGAVAGGVAGNRIAAAQDQAANAGAAQQADAERDAVSASLRDCRDPQRGTLRHSSQPERRIVGYDVEYRYKGEIYMARLPFDPGDRMRVKITVVPVE